MRMMKPSILRVATNLKLVYRTAAIALGLSAICAQAGDIGGTNIWAIPQHVVGSGNGTLDLRMFTFSGSEIQNSSGTFHGDHGNNALPKGSGPDILSFTESYVTTAGDLKQYLDLNFGPSLIHNLVVMLDLNETGGGEPTNTLRKFDVVLNPTTIQGNPNPSGDVTSAQQVGIKQVFTGGTKIAQLNPEPAPNLPVNSQGAGFADYGIFTGIDVYTLNDSDVLLFNVSMSELNNGAEELFMSGSYAPNDIRPIPEPASVTLLALGAAGVIVRRAVRKS